MIAEGISYGDAIALIDTLKENGIEANITVGGINLNPKIGDIELAKNLCKAAGAAVLQGHSTTLQNVTLWRRSE
jgi:hypothetical protein